MNSNQFRSILLLLFAGGEACKGCGRPLSHLGVIETGFATGMYCSVVWMMVVDLLFTLVDLLGVLNRWRWRFVFMLVLALEIADSERFLQCGQHSAYSSALYDMFKRI